MLSMNRTKYCFLLIVVLLAIVLISGQDPQIRVGKIEFYGYSELNIDRIRAGIPLREGEHLSPDQALAVKEKLIESIQKATGKEPTDISIICCDDKGEAEVFIGLAGKAVKKPDYNPPPRGVIKFPPQVTTLYEQMSEASKAAIQKGVIGEDDSRGYTLSKDVATRAKQLALRRYALRHEPFVHRVLESAGDAEQRQIAAEILGYARQSNRQIVALVKASRDADETVRNNAIRALGVLAKSNSRFAKEISSMSFVEMLSSGSWTDRNKAGFLLTALSDKPNPQLLRRLRARAWESLVEMARWRCQSHAYFARVLLARAAGMKEAEVQKLAQSGEIDRAIQLLQRK